MTKLVLKVKGMPCFRDGFRTRRLSLNLFSQQIPGNFLTLTRTLFGSLKFPSKQYFDPLGFNIFATGNLFMHGFPTPSLHNAFPVNLLFDRLTKLQIKTI